MVRVAMDIRISIDHWRWTNAYMGHYFHKMDVLKGGDLVLMDYAPDYRYYTSDVTRIWPVNGKYNAGQKSCTILS